MNAIDRRKVLALLAVAPFVLSGCAAGSATMPAVAMDAEAIERHHHPVARLLEEYRGRGLFAHGEAIVARDGRIVARASVGEAPAGARFDVGSACKPLLAVLVLQAVEAGLLGMDDEVGDYLSWYSPRDATIKALLVHASGLPASATQRWPSSPAELDDYRRRVAAPAVRLGPPFAQNQYYSSGYFLLAQALEAVHRQPLDVVARRGLFTPLGMTASTFDKSTVPDALSLLPIEPTTGAPQESVRRQPPNGETGLMSVAEDMLRFIDAVRRDSAAPLSATVRRQCLVEFDATGRTMAFWIKGATNGHGCFAPRQSPRTIGHPGYAGSMISQDPDTGVSIAYATNGMALHADFGNHARLQQALLDAIQDA